MWKSDTSPNHNCILWLFSSCILKIDASVGLNKYYVNCVSFSGHITSIKMYIGVLFMDKLIYWSNMAVKNRWDGGTSGNPEEETS